MFSCLRTCFQQRGGVWTRQISQGHTETILKALANAGLKRTRPREVIAAYGAREGEENLDFLGFVPPLHDTIVQLSGFVRTNHPVEIPGWCPDCQEHARRERKE
jgi:Fe2+ or Zn2+ uptake regulation protein